MNEFFSQYVTTLLDFKRLNCEETEACAELNLVISLCKLLEVFATKDNGLNPKEDTTDTYQDMAKLWFLFW